MQQENVAPVRSYRGTANAARTNTSGCIRRLICRLAFLQSSTDSQEAGCQNESASTGSHQGAFNARIKPYSSRLGSSAMLSSVGTRRMCNPILKERKTKRVRHAHAKR